MPRYHAFLYILSAPANRTHSPHGPPFLPYFRTFCTKGILLCDQYEISYNLFSKLVPGRYISGPQYILSNLPFAIHCQVLSQSIPSFSLTYCPCILFCFHSSPSPLLHSLCTLWTLIRRRLVLVSKLAFLISVVVELESWFSNLEHTPRLKKTH